jgi:ureidoglycolate lyase
VDVFKEPFESDQPVEWLITRLRFREFRVRFLERHHELTQTFIPLGGAPFISVVARADAREESGLPALDEIHAFLVPGHTAIQLHRSVWHEIPMPLHDEQVALISSHQSLTRGLESNLDERREIFKLDVEKRNLEERGDLILRVELP